MACRVLGRLIEDPQERLLGGLGHALRLWPDLEPALHEVAPTDVALDTDAAFRFLRDAVPALEQAGFGVLSPAWWDKRLRLKLTAEPFKEWEDGSGLFGLDGLCAYEWRIAVGDATLSLSELRELAAMKLPLVKSRGQWIVLRSEDVEAALKFFAGRTERGEAPAAELLRESLALDAGRGELPATEIECTGWLSELLSHDGERSSDRSRRRRRSAASCARTSSAGSPGCRSCRASASARASPTTWASARRSQMLALLLAEREAAQVAQARPDAAGLPDVGGRQLAARGRALRAACACYVHHGAGAARRATSSRAARAERTWWSRRYALAAPRPRAARRGRVGPASCSTRRRTSRTPRREADAGRARAPRAPPHRADRHAGREPPRATSGRSSTSSTPGCSAAAAASATRFATPDPALRRRRRGRAPAAG